MNKPKRISLDSPISKEKFEKIENIEKKSIPKEFTQFESIKILSWKESAQMLLNKLLKEVNNGDK